MEEIRGKGTHGEGSRGWGLEDQREGGKSETAGERKAASRVRCRELRLEWMDGPERSLFGSLHRKMSMETKI